MKYTILTGLLVLGQIAYGQVCCSLVGSIEAGGGISSTAWNTHWPSGIQTTHSKQWVIGVQNIYQNNTDQTINYGPGISGYGQFSSAINSRLVGYLQTMISHLPIQERVSYNQSSSIIDDINFSMGLRTLVWKRKDQLQIEFNLPALRRYSNSEFPFKSKTSPALSILWSRIIHLPIASLTSQFPARYTLSIFAFKKFNQVNNDINDGINIQLSAFLRTVKFLNLTSFLSLKSNRFYIASNYSDQRSEYREFYTIGGGIDLTPTLQGWNKLHVRLNIPVFQVSPKNGLPEGMEPRSILLISFILTAKNKSINNT